MRIRHLITVTLACSALAFGCKDDSISSIEKPDTPDVPSGSIDDNDSPQAITLSIGAMGLTTSVGTRGAGTVGDLAGSKDNVWHSEQLYIYAVNRYAQNLGSEFVDAEQQIPTFLKGGWLQQSPRFDFITPWGGDPAIAPAGHTDGAIEFKDSAVVYRYYPLNGAYNFMGYYLDDAKIESSGITADNRAIEINVELDGTQDVMLGKSCLSAQDTVRFIRSLINSSLLDEADISRYYDADNHKLADGLSDEEKRVIEKELNERHYSSYSNRRDVMPKIDFRHQLSRITFQVVGGNKNAVVRLSNRPKIHFKGWIQKRYMPGEFFSYQNELFMVVRDTQDELSASELFGNKENRDQFLRSIDFTLSTPKNMGDTVAYKNELYVLMKDYDGKALTWEELEPYMNNITDEELRFRPGNDYQRGECVVSPTDTSWIMVNNVMNAQEWSDVQRNAILLRQGVFVSKIELLAQNNHATLRLTPDSIWFVPGDTASLGTVTYELKERPTYDFLYGDPLVKLSPVGPEYTLEQYGSDGSKATRVGESVMVMPGAVEFFANIYITEYVDMYGNLVEGSADMTDGGNTKVYKNTRIRANSDDTKVFEAGKSYMITLTAFALQGLEVNTDLVAWNQGGTTEIDPEDQIFEGVNTITMPVAFYGINDAIPGDGYQIRRGTSWKRADLKQDTVRYDHAGVHWFAIREEYELDKWINLDNQRDYLDPKFDQIKKSDVTYTFSINIDPTRKIEFNYRLYYTIDSRGVSVTDDKRRYLVRIKEAPPK